MKYILCSILLLSFGLKAQLININNGDVIKSTDFDNNFRELENTANQYHLKLNLNTYTNDTNILSTKINQDIQKLNNFYNEGSNTSESLTQLYQGSLIEGSQVNSLFSNAKAYILNSLGQSCKNILERNPEANQDGFYQIKPQGQNDIFWTYCDMQNGGWTLLFERNMDNSSGFAPTNVVYLGESNNSNTINIFSLDSSNLTISYSDLQKAVKYVKGTYVKFPGNYVAKSTENSTFSHKVSNRTSWTESVTDTEVDGFVACDGSTIRSYTTAPTLPRIFYPAWDFSYSGSNTYTAALAGCWSNESYGDRHVFGVSVYASQTVTSCGINTGGTVPCNEWYITGKAGHRSLVIQSSKSFSTWIK